MRLKGLEPLHLAAQGPKPCVSTNSTTIATSRVDNHFYLIVNKIVALGGAHLAAERSEGMTNGEGVASGSATSFFYFVCSTTMYPLSKPLTAAFMARYKSSTSTHTHVPRWPATSIISTLSLPS